MGNSHSSEMPTRHKLFKQKPSSPLAPDTHRHHLACDDGHGLSPASARYHHGHPPGSRQTMSFHHLPSLPLQGPCLYRQPSVASLSPSAPCSPWRQPEHLDPVVWSHLYDSHVPAPLPPTPDTALARARSRLARARSVIYPDSCTSFACPDDCTQQSLSRAYSFHSNAYAPYHAQSRMETLMADRRRYSTVGLVHASGGYADMEAPLLPWEDPLSLFAQASESSSHLHLQEHSDPASCVPMRRRSVILTPGVATRATKEYPPVPTRASPPMPIRTSPPMPTKPAIQVSHQASPTRPRQGSLSCSDEPGSPGADNPELQERSVTPCDAEYRQLGGIKFGTLRITNGSPTPSPAGHGDAIASPPVASHTRQSLVPEVPALVKPVTNRNPGVEAGPEFHTSQVPPGDLSPVQPRINRGAPLLAKGRMSAHDSTSNYPHRRSPRTPDRQTSAWARQESSREYMTPDLDNDPESPRLSNKSQNDSVGSDSSFPSSATSSRQSSQRTLSKADSGYSSNFSLRSMRSTSFKLHREALRTKRASMLFPSKNQEQLQPLDTEPHHLSVAEATPSTKNSLAIVSRETLRRISTRASKLPKLSPSASTDQLAEPTNSGTVMRRATISTVSSSAAAKAGAAKQETLSKPGRLHRFLSSARRQSRVLPAFVAPHDAEPVPAIPLDLEAKLPAPEVQPRSPLRNKYTYSRPEPRQQIPKPEWNDVAADVASDAQATQHRRPRQPSLTDMPVPSYSPPSYTEMPPKVSAPPQIPIRRRPVPGMAKPSSDQSQHQGSPDAAAVKHKKEAGDGRGRGFRTSVHEVAAGSPTPSRRTLTKPDPKASTHSMPPTPLRSHASAPNLARSPMDSPPPLPKMSPSRLPQPTSLRAKLTARDLLPSQAMATKTSEVMTPSPLQRKSRESLNGRPSSARSLSSVQMAAQPPLRHSYSVYGRYPPVVYRQPRQRQVREAADCQSYRILHSYNSPAYRNAPIWG